MADVVILGVDRQPIPLESSREVQRNELSSFAEHSPERLGKDFFRVQPGESLLAHACRYFFGLYSDLDVDRPLPVEIVEFSHGHAPGLHGLLYREIVLRFKVGVTPEQQSTVLRGFDLKPKAITRASRGRLVVQPNSLSIGGMEIVNIARDLAQHDDVEFATPNIVGQFRPHGGPTAAPAPASPCDSQWHLENVGTGGQLAGQDLRATRAWNLATGAGIVVALMDDGVDVDHPALSARIEPGGRDYYFADSDPRFFDPRPKEFCDFSNENRDIHGTACAGLIAADHPRASGVAPRSRILPVKIQSGANWQDAEVVAEALEWAGRQADVLSCSWGYPQTGTAIADALRELRYAGIAVFFAAGDTFVDYPASDINAIAVGASTDQGRRAPDSPIDPKILFVAPSDGGICSLLTTDVTEPAVDPCPNPGVPQRTVGYSPGNFTDAFGGTSAAAALAASVAALVLSANRYLSRTHLLDVLKDTAEGLPGLVYPVSGPNRGRNDESGYGRLNAEAAVREAIRRR